jgi:RimJ/RimL family protein N-acetyltransferase
MASLCEKYLVRELSVSDLQEFAEFFDFLDAGDVRSRFNGANAGPLALLPSERPEAHGAALGAFGPGGALIGVANLEPVGDGGAEVAILVRSDWKRHGAGNCLMSKTIDFARHADLTRLVAYVNPENTAINALTRKSGFRVVAVDRYATELALPLAGATRIPRAHASRENSSFEEEGRDDDVLVAQRAGPCARGCGQELLQ